MEKNNNTVGGSIIALVSLLSAAAFLFIGFTTHVWHPTWLVFLSIPIVSMIVDVTAKKKDPVSIVSGIVSIVCAVVYLYLGFFRGLWHPGWLIFFAVPISSVITGMFVKKSPDAQDNDNDRNSAL